MFSSLFLQYTSDFYFAHNQLINFFEKDHNRKTVELKLPILLDLLIRVCTQVAQW